MESGPARPPWYQDDSPETYARLRAVASALMRFERRDHTLTPTALVHEAVLRMVTGPAAQGDPAPAGGVGPQLAMKRVLLDHARGRARHKRRAACRREQRDPDSLACDPLSTTILSIQEALQRLRAVSPERAEVWELHYLAGRSTEALAGARGVTQRSVQLWLRAANAFLRARLAGEED